MHRDAEITQLLNRSQAGDGAAREQAFALIYSELKKIAFAELRRHGPGSTWGATALVNEAYARLAAHYAGTLNDRKHFYRLAARAMRQVVIDRARELMAEKRGGGVEHVGLTFGDAAAEQRLEDWIALDQALAELAKQDERAAQIVEWHFFGGQSFEDIAAMLGVSDRTVRSDWAFARALLARALQSSPLPE
jgi:RNA polymerase sigma factor (TIGR02999 family)